MLPENVSERHRAVAKRFTEVVEGVQDWSAPTPVKEWQARDIVVHMTSWLPGMLQSGGVSVDLPPGPDAATDPVGAWKHQTEAVQQLLDDPATAIKEFTSEWMGTMPLPEVLDRFYNADTFMHTWDLARATGQNDVIDDEYSAQMLAGMEQMEDSLRASGQFGERQPVADDAPAHLKLMAFVGRDPGWQPA